MATWIVYWGPRSAQSESAMVECQYNTILGEVWIGFCYCHVFEHTTFCLLVFWASQESHSPVTWISCFFVWWWHTFYCLPCWLNETCLDQFTNQTWDPMLWELNEVWWWAMNASLLKVVYHSLTVKLKLHICCDALVKNQCYAKCI